MKGDQMGTHLANPSPRELPLSNQTRFKVERSRCANRSAAMPVFAANLSLMFTEWGFLDRFAAAADAGLTAVEFLFPYEFSPEDIGRRLQGNHLRQALFNLPPG